MFYQNLIMKNTITTLSLLTYYKKMIFIACKFKKKIKFDLLTSDVAHLKVSANSLNKDFDKELKYLFNQTDYLHLSGNDSLEDSNKSLMNDNIIIKFLKNNSLKNKISFTLEVYDI